MNKPGAHTHEIMDVGQIKKGAAFSVRFFTGVLILTAVILVVIAFYDHHADVAVRNLKERFNQIHSHRNDIIRFDEILTMSARMAAATADMKWEERYRLYEPQLTRAIERAIALSPEVYRKETHRTGAGKIKLLEMEHEAFGLIRKGKVKEAMELLFGGQYERQKEDYVRAIERLNLLSIQQVDAALEVEHSKEQLARVAFITVLIFLLLSSLIILNTVRATQEALKTMNQRLILRTQELDELNKTLDQKVQERTVSLSKALQDLHQTHRDLQNAQTQLLQSEKFSAIGQLAAGVAHEINNPLGFINSNLQSLEQYVAHYTQLLGILNKLEIALKDKDAQKVSTIVTSWEKIRTETNFAFIGGDIGNLLKESRDGVEKISKIILDLRAFASPDKGIMENIHVEGLIESMLNIVWNEIKYKAELQKEYGDVPFIVCNPQKIGQVFVNLLINAAHAIETKGIIHIKTYLKDDFVCVDFTDNGCGIAPDQVTKVFDPFYTTKPVGKGAGLGLSICYDIVRKHGGDLTFKTTTGKGTTFTVKLPVSFAYDSASS